MKILESYAGALTNFEVLNFLNSRGASRDPTRVIASIAQSEYKTRECINEFLEKCKKYNLAKAEMLNIINLRPCSVVEIDPDQHSGRRIGLAKERSGLYHFELSKTDHREL
ncbi:uncharacterized protein LOC110820081 isoform X4 [Carica papaya]|uniref:uncharacterized protein LOC110820081 isoform X4 n=1 Tax=Carica papaya TaxID=3649 RepID=UPI000B8D060A|nr:uncharacterized protein LOC110820081 isoform X4 [Carica papaya]